MGQWKELHSVSIGIGFALWHHCVEITEYIIFYIIEGTGSELHPYTEKSGECFLDIPQFEESYMKQKDFFKDYVVHVCSQFGVKIPNGLQFLEVVKNLLLLFRF